MSEFIKTLFEEKEKLDEICHIEEQQRKKIGPMSRFSTS